MFMESRSPPMDQPMEQQYGTQELIEILAAERQACLRGERLSLSAGSGHPVIDGFLQTDGSQSYSAFQDFKAAVHQYQIKHQVSGLQWQTVSFKGESLTYPVIHPQLWAIDRDFTCLGDARDRVVSFWRYVSSGLIPYQSVSRGRDFLLVDGDAIEAIQGRSDWATLAIWQREDFLEVVLQLGWGQPTEVADWRNGPDSGCDYIHGVRPGQRPVC
jgi:hypothetical protein